ncbi:hypothetical protein ACQEVC_42725 [Plantactinospora sp. CA-294935]|uniref:hypothetical protein n=1 Tax=Plantactinospora sp. CA-294935 TaxID=3240012 RepID=UPI003D93F6F2
MTVAELLHDVHERLTARRPLADRLKGENMKYRKLRRPGVKGGHLPLDDEG